MAVKIRLKRMGKKKMPSYRVVVADARSPRDGRIIEKIGWYNPLSNPSTLQIDEEKALKWLKNGAQPTEVVVSLLKRTGTMARFEQTKAPQAPDTQQTPAE
jgi:small subunit ribosomal protein S16